MHLQWPHYVNPYYYYIPWFPPPTTPHEAVHTNANKFVTQTLPAIEWSFNENKAEPIRNSRGRHTFRELPYQERREVHDRFVTPRSHLEDAYAENKERKQKKIRRPTQLYTIPPNIGSMYCASGILPIAQVKNTVYILLTCEDRSRKSGRTKDRRVLMNPGGKRTAFEGPEETALREFHEVGRYVLFVCKVPYIETVNQVFSKAVLSSKSRGSDSELHQGLHYVPLQNLHDVAHSGDTTLTVDGLTLDVYTFLIEMLNGIEEGGWNLVNSSNFMLRVPLETIAPKEWGNKKFHYMNNVHLFHSHILTTYNNTGVCYFSDFEGGDRYPVEHLSYLPTRLVQIAYPLLCTVHGHDNPSSPDEEIEFVQLLDVTDKKVRFTVDTPTQNSVVLLTPMKIILVGKEEFQLCENKSIALGLVKPKIIKRNSFVPSQGLSRANNHLLLLANNRDAELWDISGSLPSSSSLSTSPSSSSSSLPASPPKTSGAVLICRVQAELQSASFLSSKLLEDKAFVLTSDGILVAKKNQPYFQFLSLSSVPVLIHPFGNHILVGLLNSQVVIIKNIATNTPILTPSSPSPPATTSTPVIQPTPTSSIGHRQYPINSNITITSIVAPTSNNSNNNNNNNTNNNPEKDESSIIQQVKKRIKDFYFIGKNLFMITYEMGLGAIFSLEDSNQLKPLMEINLDGKIVQGNMHSSTFYFIVKKDAQESASYSVVILPTKYIKGLVKTATSTRKDLRLKGDMAQWNFEEVFPPIQSSTDDTELLVSSPRFRRSDIRGGIPIPKHNSAKAEYRKSDQRLVKNVLFKPEASSIVNSPRRSVSSSDPSHLPSPEIQRNLQEPNHSIPSVVEPTTHSSNHRVAIRRKSEESTVRTKYINKTHDELKPKLRSPSTSDTEIAHLHPSSSSTSSTSSSSSSSTSPSSSASSFPSSASSSWPSSISSQQSMSYDIKKNRRKSDISEHRKSSPTKLSTAQSPGSSNNISTSNSSPTTTIKTTFTSSPPTQKKSPLSSSPNSSLKNEQGSQRNF